MRVFTLSFATPYNVCEFARPRLAECWFPGLKSKDRIRNGESWILKFKRRSLTNAGIKTFYQSPN